MKSEWPPRDDAFQAFLAWLSPDRDEAGRRFENLRQKLERFFIQGGCHIPDEMFHETWTRAANRKCAGKVDSSVDAAVYCYGVARNVLREYRRDYKPGELPEEIVFKPSQPIWTEDEMQCLDHCLNLLKERDRDLVLRFFLFEGRQKIESHKEMAANESGLGALRTKVCRIKKNLRSCVKDCLDRRQGRTQ